MASSKNRTLQIAITSLAAGSMLLSACATKPERKGPPQDRQGHGPARSSGTFVKPVGLLFAGMDKDSDAIVTRPELDAGIQAEWSNFDRNPSAAYFSAWSIQKLGSTDALPTFMMFDKNFNGVISAEEFSERLEIEFKQADKNSDGRLERSEMIIAFAAPRGQSKPQGREDGGKRGEGRRQRR